MILWYGSWWLPAALPLQDHLVLQVPHHAGHYLQEPGGRVRYQQLGNVSISLVTSGRIRYHQKEGQHPQE